MNKENVTFQVDSDKKLALDALAASMNCDRSYILNEAIQMYLEMYRWQIEEIKRGVAEAEAGDFATPEEVKNTFAKLSNAN
ncbi:CopG family ribbon-helix-helix protein [Gloeocapsa sp. PCC 73106]|uniref:CopG family ribbon-helix-helix protein n=1 Tax=Gloeocapsa sp. PCC 73106 TaxID=102232 RepID=UPI0002AC4BF5|nr:hypothetical protein [Gloeocapsa sp. PCC 73106]ELR99997.1 putative transcriptional regulator [Gloeocapsa sp. PCC 73106]